MPHRLFRIAPPDVLGDPLVRGALLLCYARLLGDALFICSALFMCCALFGAHPARAQAMADEGSPLPELILTPDFDAEGTIGRFDPITLTLNRPLDADDGRLAMFVGATDLSALVELDRTTLRYRPSIIPLPSGRSELIIYLVSAGAPWREVARFPIHIRLPGGFEAADLDPNLTLNNKGRLAEGAFPVVEPPSNRGLFQDFSGQFDARGSITHSGWTVSTQAQILGVSYEKEALRFGELQQDAPKIDLAGYHARIERGVVGIQVGDVSQGRHRHLVSGLRSRGVTASVAPVRRLDFSLGVMNGTRVVGWRNLSGLSDPDHRILSGTIGVDLFKRPGALRMEGSYLAGSVRPRTDFNQGGVPDAETNRGGGIRLAAATANQRIRVEAGYAGSRYTNPFDPTLAQGDPVVPVQTETRFAHYVEASASILQNVRLAPHLPVGIDAAYRRERVDPLYRSVAAFVQADQLRNTFEMRGNVGGAGIQLAHTRSEDNLDEIPSILKTHTRRYNAGLGVPLRALLTPTTSGPVFLLPTLSYSFNQTHQFGADLPVDGGFSPSHVPDQMTRIHNAGVTWQATRWSFGYRFNSSFQDNRQEDREDADFVNDSHSLSLTLDPLSRISVGLDLAVDRRESRADGRIDRTTRYGLRSSLRPVQPLTLSGSIAPTLTKNREQTSRSANTNVRLEGTYSFELGSGLRWPARGQVFIRYTRQTATFRDILFELDSDTRMWAVNSGINLTLF